MNVLAFETSTAVASVALSGSPAGIQEIVIGAAQKQNEALLPAIDSLLDAAGVTRGSLDAVVIGGGPGSFTGLRVAAATAKGFCHALSIPFYAYSGLLAAAAGYASAGRVCALFDARRDEVYSATYDFAHGLQTAREPTVESIEQALARHADAALFVGDGALKHRTEITRRGGQVADDERVVPRASALLWLLQEFPEQGRVADPAHWEPNYIRASGAERGVRG